MPHFVRGSHSTIAGVAILSMRTVSTRALGEQPDVPTFRRLTRSLAVLDAILSPVWEDRYYSFNAHWAPGELMASMRNGQGDQWFAAINASGVILFGLDHESPMYQPDNPWPGVLDGIPPEFAAFRDEPAFDTRHTTFCLWRRAAAPAWERGPVQFPPGDDPDGSADLLRHLDGRPETYVTFAAEYYEVDVPLDAVAAIYRHEPLTDALVARLNPTIGVRDLASDLAEIGFPESP
jgi:hypothetical protein